MGTDLSLYRAAIGNFSAKSFFFFRVNLCALPFHILIWVYTSMIILGKLTCCFTQYLFLRSRRVTFSTFSPSSKKSIYLSWLFFFSLINRILLIIGGIESNPGDSPPPTSRFSFATFNIDSLLARDGCKLAAIEGIDSIYKFDLFGICESYLTPSIENQQISLEGFSPEPFRSDCPSLGSRPKGGVCLYYKDHVPIKRRTDLEFLEECIICEIVIQKKKFFYILAYRSPNQSVELFSNFMAKLQLTFEKINLENPFAIILTGDLNCRSPLFWDEESFESTEGKTLSNFTLLNGLEQLINHPTHFPRPGVETCIDHIFTNQTNAIIDSGVIPSTDPCCKHSIVFGKVNMSIPTPPPYKRTIWEFSKANVGNIRASLSAIDWVQLFEGKNPTEMVELFQKKLLEIMKACIPNKMKIFNDRDAPWITPEVKSTIRKNKRVFKKWIANGRKPDDRVVLARIQFETNKVINKAKNDYLSDLGSKICDPNTGQKCFWTAFNRLLNNKKITNIPPLIENNKYIACFKEKAKIFNDYFALQCRPLVTPSSLPPFRPLTNERLSEIPIELDKICAIISKLNSKKASGFDGISIAMLKLCTKEVAIPLSLIFKCCLSHGIFPAQWKKANVQPVHKKNSRQIKSNYRPISLLPICSKIFEKIIFDHMYSFLLTNKLLSKNQSGFRPGDSTINQLLSITTEIFNAFENLDETRAVFLDISKAFDKVWHEGLCFKLKQNGIDGNLLKLLSSFLADRKQRVVLNGTCSEWEGVLSGVPQGSVLGPLLFLIYINDLTDNINSNIRLFADDSSLFIKVRTIEEAQALLSTDLETITAWATQWKMEFNPEIAKQAIEVIFSTKYKRDVHPPLSCNGIPVSRQEWTKHLGFHLDEKLSFKKHVSEAIIKAKKGIALLKFLSKYINREKLDLAYKMHVRPHLEYGDVIFHARSADLMKLIESVQYQAGLIVGGCWKGTSREKLYKELGWESLADRRIFRRHSLYYKILNQETPEYLTEHLLTSPPSGTNRYKNSFFPFCYNTWQDLDPALKGADSLSKFKSNYLKNIRPKKQNFYGIIDRTGIPRLTRMRVDFSDLRDHRFNHSFRCNSPICDCTGGIESTEHFFLHCPKFNSQRQTLLSNIATALNTDISVFPDSHLTEILMYGSPSFNNVTNKIILTASLHYIKSTGRFNQIEAYRDITPLP